jgi:hypothetical protein
MPQSATVQAIEYLKRGGPWPGLGGNAYKNISVEGKKTEKASAKKLPKKLIVAVELGKEHWNVGYR